MGKSVSKCWVCGDRNLFAYTIKNKHTLCLICYINEREVAKELIEKMKDIPSIPPHPDYDEIYTKKRVDLIWERLRIDLMDH